VILSPRLCFSIKRLSEFFFASWASVKPKSTWAILKPHVESIISGFVFPQLVFGDELAELWQSDPVEFARRSIEMDDISSPSAASLSFVLQLAQSRFKATFVPILTFIRQILENP
jgi:hypothetical protein